MEIKNDDLNQTEVEIVEGKRNNKTRKVVIMMVLVILFILSGFSIFKLLSKEKLSKEKLPKENKTINYKLVKYADYNEKINYVADANFFEDYFVIIGYNCCPKQQHFKVFKNGKEVLRKEQVGSFEIERIGNLNKYYLINNDPDQNITASLIDISGKNSNLEIYENIIPIGNVLLVNKYNKYGVIDADGKTIIELKYDHIQYQNEGANYLFAQLDGKIGILGVDGKTIIPLEYESDKETDEYDYYDYEYEYYDYGKIIEDENDYFILKSKNEFFVLDDNNNVILKDNRKIAYDEILNHFIINKTNTTIYEYYSLDGALKKEIDYDNESWLAHSVTGYDFFTFKSDIALWLTHPANELDDELDVRLFRDKNNDSTIYALDKNLNMTRYEDVYYIRHNYEETDTIDYFITKNVYVTFEGGKYYLKSTKDKSPIGNYDFIDYYHFWDANTVFVACNDEKSCGLIDLAGKEITSFNYELIEYGSILKNNEEIIIMAHNQWKKTTCSDNQKMPSSVYEIYDNFFVDWFAGSDYIIFNNKCEPIHEKKIRNYEYLENGFIIAKIEEIEEMESTKDDQSTRAYYVFYNNGKEITYENTDDAEPYHFLAYNDNKMYFLTNKGIYYLTGY